jgi:hypothetical protein
MNRHFRGEFRERRAGDEYEVVTDQCRSTPLPVKGERAKASAATPLELARRRLGWSYRELATKVGASHVAAFRWCRGLRPAPFAVYLALGVPAPAQERQAGAEDHPPARVTVSLPKGCDEQSALEACVRAVAQALTEPSREEIW